MRASVLFADGSPELRSAAIRVLEEAGCEVLPASNGREALWILNRHRPDMVMAEIALPGIDGIALAWHIRSWFPDVPILLMSSELAETELAELRPLYNALVPRPVPAARLVDLAECLSPGEPAGGPPFATAAGRTRTG